MILIAGIPTEGPMARVIEALDAIGAAYRVLDQREAGRARMVLEIGGAEAGGAIGGWLEIAGEPLPLDKIRGVYLRMMDDRLLPDGPADALAASRRRVLHELLLRWADIAHARVLNRPSAMASNQSKPYQAHVIRRHGFGVPQTLIASDPDVVRDFIERAWAEGGEVIYKSVSGVRSIVERVVPDDLARLDRIRWCPTQFQRRVTGTDIRVHVVGNTALAAAIETDATDYRYAGRQTGAELLIAPAALAPEETARCIRLATALDLPLAGVDLRRTPEGELVCFEVNPSPAFSFYEERAGVPIAMAIARYLAGDAH